MKTSLKSSRLKKEGLNIGSLLSFRCFMQISTSFPGGISGEFFPPFFFVKTLSKAALTARFSLLSDMAGDAGNMESSARYCPFFLGYGCNVNFTFSQFYLQ